MRVTLVAAVLVLVACDRHPSVTGDAAPAASSSVAPAASARRPSPLERPYALHLPPGLDPTRRAPLVVALHGYGAPGGEAYARALGLVAMADEQGFVLAMPDGTVDSRGNHFWNASDACCDFDHSGVDDVSYIAWVIHDAGGKTPIDPARVFLVGHSNGGFLAHRLACDHAPIIAAAVSIAGAAWKDPSRCTPSQPVSVLQIQGDADVIIRPGGGRVFDRPLPEYPSTRDSMAMWVDKDGCGAEAQSAGLPLDFDSAVPGAETTRTGYPACRNGVRVDLWTVAGGSHVPRPSHAGLQALGVWLMLHPKPAP